MATVKKSSHYKEKTHLFYKWLLEIPKSYKARFKKTFLVAFFVISNAKLNKTILQLVIPKCLKYFYGNEN